MLKPTGNYRMSKQNKISLGREWNNPHRGQIRRAIIDAELASKIVIKREPRKDSPRSNDKN